MRVALILLTDFYGLGIMFDYSKYLSLRIDLIKLNIHIRFDGTWSLSYSANLYKILFRKDPVTGKKI